MSEKIELLSRELLEELSNRCARLGLHKINSDEYLSLYCELCSEVESIQSMDDFIHKKNCVWGYIDVNKNRSIISKLQK